MKKSIILQKTIKNKEFILYQNLIEAVCLILKAKKICCLQIKDFGILS